MVVTHPEAGVDQPAEGAGLPTIHVQLGWLCNQRGVPLLKVGIEQTPSVWADLGILCPGRFFNAAVQPTALTSVKVHVLQSE